MKPLTFEQALKKTDGNRHVLLGNGFSQAWRSDIFAYNALFDRAEFKGLSNHARKAFDTLTTHDFEIVMRALRQTSLLVKLYAPEIEDLPQELEDDVDGLRNVLVQTISDSHPDLPSKIAEPQFAACREFLSRFDRIYTLNYDLLLYWALMHDDSPPQVKCDDGFRRPANGAEDYVTWDPASVGKQNVYYLHGALHLFDAGSELQKYTWVNTGVPLIAQVREALENNRYPHFIAEGDSDLKLTRIRHSAYLSRGERSFLSIGGTLFTFGVGFGDSDEHILHWLSKNKVKKLVVGLYGDPEGHCNEAVRTRVEAAAGERADNHPLKVLYYDASSAKVWG